MADSQPQQKIETPPDVVKAPSKDPLIFTMPEEYRGGGTGKKMAEPVKETPKPAPVITKPAAPPVAPKPAAMVQPKKKKGPAKALILFGILFLLLLGGGGFALVYFNKPAPVEEPVKPPTKPVTQPEEENPPEVQEPPEEENPPTNEPFPQASASGKDTDSDGLTDVEETVVYSTNPRLPDTDGDGFLDGNEVFHRYNPNGTAPGTLLGSGLVKEYADGIYDMLYPSVWNAQADEQDDSSVVFTTTTGETVSVSVEDKSSASQTLEEWYAAQNADGAYVATTTKNGYKALTTQDKLTVYIDAGEQVLVLSYNTGIKATIEYLQTFQMMVNSVVFR
jgi:hypothetical protein